MIWMCCAGMDGAWMPVFLFIGMAAIEHHLHHRAIGLDALWLPSLTRQRQLRPVVGLTRRCLRGHHVMTGALRRPGRCVLVLLRGLC